MSHLFKDYPGFSAQGIFFDCDAFEKIVFEILAKCGLDNLAFQDKFYKWCVEKYTELCRQVAYDTNGRMIQPGINELNIRQHMVAEELTKRLVAMRQQLGLDSKELLTAANKVGIVLGSQKQISSGTTAGFDFSHLKHDAREEVLVKRNGTPLYKGIPRGFTLNQ